MKMEKVFQVESSSNRYQNIRIGVEADTAIECTRLIYEAYCIERLFYYTLLKKADAYEAIQNVYEQIPEMVESLNEFLRRDQELAIMEDPVTLNVGTAVGPNDIS